MFSQIKKPTGWYVLFAVFVVTTLFFLILCQLFPSTQLFDTYVYLENISINLLLSLVLALLLVSTVTRYNHLVMTLTLGASLGMVFFIIVLNIKLVDPTQIHWLMREDWQWHFMGWQFFRHEPWHLPIIGKITGIYFPIGTSIGFTDSIPLFALFFKLFTPLLSAQFQYIGLWLLSCFTLQGLFAALLLRLLSQNLFIQAIGTLFFVFSPVLLLRLSHPALCAHWLLLAGLWMYFRSWKSKPLWGWMLLVSLSALIHPYLTAMILGLVVAFYTRLWLIEQRDTAVSVVGQLILMGGILLLIWWLLGYFLIGDQNHMAGHASLGYYSMNLLAPFNPLGGISVLLKEMPIAMEGQYEGFNYLGMGVLIMGIWAIYELQQRPVSPVTLKKLLPLGVICIVFTGFAISNKVTIAHHLLIDLKSDLLNIFAPFQSSGRFFWPVNYALLFFLIKILIRRNLFRNTLILFSFALTIQTLDLHGLHQDIHHRSRDSSLYIWNNPLKSDNWDLISTQYQHITLVPPSTCGEAAAPYLPFSYLAGHSGMSLNTGIAARVDVKKIMHYCDTLLTSIRQGKIKDNSIYILHSKYLADFQTAAQKPVVCMKLDGFNTCMTERSYLQFADHYR